MWPHEGTKVRLGAPSQPSRLSAKRPAVAVSHAGSVLRPSDQTIHRLTTPERLRQKPRGTEELPSKALAQAEVADSQTPIQQNDCLRPQVLRWFVSYIATYNQKCRSNSTLCGKVTSQSLYATLHPRHGDDSKNKNLI